MQTGAEVMDQLKSEDGGNRAEPDPGSSWFVPRARGDPVELHTHRERTNGEQKAARAGIKIIHREEHRADDDGGTCDSWRITTLDRVFKSVSFSQDMQAELRCGVEP